MGLGIVIEYANQRGEPAVRTAKGGGLGPYSVRQTGLRTEARGYLPLTLEKILGGRAGYNRWTINGLVNNNSGDTHPCTCTGIPSR
jgi:hypothetical protein